MLCDIGLNMTSMLRWCQPMIYS